MISVAGVSFFAHFAHLVIFLLGAGFVLSEAGTADDDDDSGNGELGTASSSGSGLRSLASTLSAAGEVPAIPFDSTDGAGSFSFSGSTVASDDLTGGSQSLSEESA